MCPWKCHNGHIIELCDESNDCTKFQFYTKKKFFRDIPFFVILNHFALNNSAAKSAVIIRIK